eukprot:TRINITY_DN6091_c0_g1_i2.p1 TRINITY_DN6091_c0_g1~~TRINITY_DN6091_c0_g1_i2.p1  ORF type:complete len:632 (+),score=118.95 TRINITY_DN6091_c0_g1_i2:72-1967(+)
MESLARGLGQSHINPGSAAHQETDLIHSVQRQSHDLARYKESCRTLQEQLNLQREKHRLYRMDVELTIQTMQQRIHQLESIERQLREENTKLSTNPPPMLQKHIDDRIEKLEAQITAYRVDADRQRQLRSQIEEELKNVTSTSKMSIADSKRREDSLNSMINQFKEQVNRIQDQYQEKDNALRSSQMLMTRQHQELEERIHELNQRSETIRRLEREKSDLLHSMSALQGRVDQLRVSLQAALGSGVRNEDVSMAVVHHDLSRILDLHHREESQYASLIAHQQDTIEKLQTEISELQRKHEDSIAAHAYSSLPPPPSPDPLALANVDKLVHFIRILEETFGEVLQGDKLREKDFIRASHFGGELEVELHEVRSTFVSHLRKVEELCSHRHELHQRVSHYENSLPVESKKVHELSAKLESHEEEKKRLTDRIHELQQTLQSRNGMIGDLCTQLFESNVKMGISAKPPPPSSAMAVLFSSIDPEHVPWSVVYKALTEQVYLNSKSVVSRQDRFAKSPPHAKSPIRSKVITAQSYESEDDTSVYSEETMTIPFSFPHCRVTILDCNMQSLSIDLKVHCAARVNEFVQQTKRLHAQCKASSNPIVHSLLRTRQSHETDFKHPQQRPSFLFARIQRP